MTPETAVPGTPLNFEGRGFAPDREFDITSFCARSGAGRGKVECLDPAATKARADASGTLRFQGMLRPPADPALDAAGRLELWHEIVDGVDDAVVSVKSTLTYHPK